MFKTHSRRHATVLIKAEWSGVQDTIGVPGVLAGVAEYTKKIWLAQVAFLSRERYQFQGRSFCAHIDSEDRHEEGKEKGSGIFHEREGCKKGDFDDTYVGYRKVFQG